MRHIKKFTKALFVSIFMFIVCGMIYPLLVTGLAQLFFPNQAAGSLIKMDDKIVGSKLVGQEFTDNSLFHSRPSSIDYNTFENKESYEGLRSGSQNLAVSNPDLTKRINKDIEKFIKENPTVSKEDIPEDIITQSASGLDPHISVKSAKLQLDRVSKNSGLSKEVINNLIIKNTDNKLLGIFGEDTVNVLELNIDLMNEMKK